MLADWQRTCIGALLDDLKTSDRAGVTGPSTLTAQWAADSNELRYFKPGDVCTVRFEGLGSAEVTFAK